MKEGLEIIYLSEICSDQEEFQYNSKQLYNKTIRKMFMYLRKLGTKRNKIQLGISHFEGRISLISNRFEILGYLYHNNYDSRIHITCLLPTYSKCSKYFVSGYENGLLSVWDANTRQPFQLLQKEGAISSITWLNAEQIAFSVNLGA